MWGGCLWLRTVEYDGLALLPTQMRLWDGFHGCWGSLVRLIGSWDWVLYSVLDGTIFRISFPALAEQHDVTQGLYSSLFGDPNHARMCCKFPGQVRPLALLCRWGKTHAVISVQMPLNVWLWNGLCSFLYALVSFPGWRGQRLYSVMSGAMN